jgi:hypothetical protein
MAIAPSHLDRRLVRRARQDRLFQLSQPRPRRQPERFEAVLSHLHVRFLFDRVREARHIVIDKAATHAEGRLFVQDIVKQLE